MQLPEKSPDSLFFCAHLQEFWGSLRNQPGILQPDRKDAYSGFHVILLREGPTILSWPGGAKRGSSLYNIKIDIIAIW